MTILAIVLVSTAAVIHAFWNLLGKRQSPTAAFFLIATVTGAAILTPLLVRDRAVLALVPVQVWVLVALSSVFETVYYIALAGAYRNGDMSLAYPLARALPTLLITIGALAQGSGEPITPLSMVGIVAVALGCLILPLRNWRTAKLADYLNACCVLAVIAAMGTTGYTLVDNEALRMLRSLGTSGVGNVEMTLIYLGLTSVGAAVGLAVFVTLNRAERTRLRQLACGGTRYAVLAGVVIAIGYGMVLVAMAHATNVSYIGAFRQTSIPLGAALGIIVEHEPLYRAKVIGTAVALAGLILVALA